MKGLPSFTFADSWEEPLEVLPVHFPSQTADELFKCLTADIVPQDMVPFLLPLGDVHQTKFVDFTTEMGTGCGELDQGT